MADLLKTALTAILQKIPEAKPDDAVRLVDAFRGLLALVPEADVTRLMATKVSLPQASDNG